MPRSALTGTRIRERRIAQGMRQADLAGRAGISASYLNLIEHNRRRIGGKLVLALADALGVDPAALTEGADAALLEWLRMAAARAQDLQPELPLAEDFARRFPGWAGLLADRYQRVAELERMVETLSDRLTHDPLVSAALHDLLSAVTAIRSTAAILTDTTDLDRDWQARFLRNLREDSRRVTGGAQALVNYLDSEQRQDRPGTPQDELDAFVAARDFHFPELESDRPADIDALIAAAPQLASAPARAMAGAWLAQYHADARRLPAQAFTDAARQTPDPGLLANHFAIDAITVFRRLACLAATTADEVGLAICDASGTLVFRKPLPGFTLPRFGASCPLWPLYQALSQPGMPVRALVEQPASPPRYFQTFAICQPVAPGAFDAPPVLQSAMLIRPAAAEGPARPIGISCRICPRVDCTARREPSILAGGL